MTTKMLLLEFTPQCRRPGNGGASNFGQYLGLEYECSSYLICKDMDAASSTQAFYANTPVQDSDTQRQETRPSSSLFAFLESQKSFPHLLILGYPP